MKIPLTIRRLVRLIRFGNFKSQELVRYESFLNSEEFDQPQPILNISIDFELAWSRAKRQNGATSNQESVSRGRKAREVMPLILDLSNQYNIPITFAIVGHLALNSCSEHKKPPLFQPYWFREDWFNIDPGENYSNRQLYFAADIMQDIIKSPVKHEIASHSFTHVNFGDDATTDEVAQYEVSESARALEKFEPNLTTFVFPKNKPAFLGYLKKSGFKIYRSDKSIRIQKDELGLWQFPVGLWISPTVHNTKEIINLLDRAVEKKSLVNVWFHGYEFDSLRSAKSFLEPIFKAADQRREMGLETKTMRDIIYDHEQC